MFALNLCSVSKRQLPEGVTEQNLKRKHFGIEDSPANNVNVFVSQLSLGKRCECVCGVRRLEEGGLN